MSGRAAGMGPGRDGRGATGRGRGREAGRGRGRGGGRGIVRGGRGKSTEAVEKVNKNPDRSIKNQIRGVERLLKKTDLTSEVKAMQEARLVTLNEDLQQSQLSEKERKFSIMYKKVRFTERVKIDRCLKRARKAVEGAVARGETPSAEAQQALDSALNDLEYVKEFPRDEKYVSIIVDPTEEEELKRIIKERVRLRSKIKMKLAERAALADADEGVGLQAAATKLAGSLAHEKKVHTPNRVVEKAAKSGTDEDNEEDSDSEDGFFDDADSDSAEDTRSPDKSKSDPLSASKRARVDTEAGDDDEAEPMDGMLEEGVALEPVLDDDSDADLNEAFSGAGRGRGRGSDRGRGVSSRGRGGLEGGRASGGRGRGESSGRGRGTVGNSRGGHSGRGAGRGDGLAGRGGGGRGGKKESVKASKAPVPSEAQRTRAEGARKRRKKT